MPLKHLTETVLIVFLGLAAIATGIAISVLPPIPEGFVSWAILLVATVVYPTILYPLLKGNRADYSFRALHFAPVAITLGWVLIQIAILKDTRTRVVHDVYTWGFGMMPVAVVFLLLAAFCLHVIRRRVPRIMFMALMLAPFAVVSYASERYMHWDLQLASLLWQDRPMQIARQSPESASLTLSASSRGEKNLSASSVPEEEAWRQKLRNVEQEKVHSAISVAGTIEGVNVALNLSMPAESGSVVGARRIARKTRTRLPKSGGEIESVGLLFLAGFAGTLHARARRRAI